MPVRKKDTDTALRYLAPSRTSSGSDVKTYITLSGATNVTRLNIMPTRSEYLKVIVIILSTLSISLFP